MQPSGIVTAYEDFLLKNVTTVQTVESAIRNITYFLPGRFEDSEVASEGLYAVSSLVSTYHDSLLSRRVPASISLPPHPFSQPSTSTSVSNEYEAILRNNEPTRIVPLIPAPSDHARYTRYWTERSKTYRRASRILVTINYIELLVEMVAKKKAGDRARWRVVLGIESIKTLLRLLILRITKRPILQHPTPTREYDISQLPQEILNSASTTPSHHPISVPALSSLPSNAPLRSHLYPLIDALPEDHRPNPLTLLPELSSVSEYTSEILACSATLVQVILLLRRAQKPRNNMYKPSSLPSLSTSLPPFLIPLALLLLSRRLRPSPQAPTALQSAQRAQRDRQIASFFFLKGPIWVGWTRPKLMGVIKGLERIPLIGIIGELVEGYVPLLDDYFYYTSS